MSAGEQTLHGPDLTQGISAAEIPDGGILLGHANGEAVLLSRRGTEVFAISATCSHYGGPLAEGVIDGDTVRCPWHHACFSLRTGEALRAPALSPVACWKVEKHGDTVTVGAKFERDPLAVESPIAASAHPERIAIIGGGAAGAAAAEMLRRRGFTGSVTIIDADPASPYDRPNLSKDYLAGAAQPEWIPLRPPEFYGEHGIAIVRASATRIDLAAKRVETDAHDAVPFDALLLAMGAEPLKLPLEGSETPHVFYLRSLADSNAIIAATKDATHPVTRAVVIGASFIGLEVAASLRARGLDVHVVAPEKRPLERILGAALGDVIRKIHEEKGVHFHLERKPQRIENNWVILDDGHPIDAELVVIGVGVKPRLALAEQAGLAIDRGVTVNEHLETSVSGIYAAGDIARWPDPHSGERIRVEHWVVAERMGQVAARNMLGANEKFEHVPFFWSAHYDTTINYVGHAEKWDAIRVEGSGGDRNMAVRYERGGKLLALATISRDQASLDAEIGMERAT
jgi:NADPH-dependent 2,4-dienoyl-CoA reductase/sulfur reductase-like enzyme/nitrite reductase/ring-hydroxylating ferredoxin subunit